MPKMPRYQLDGRRTGSRPKKKRGIRRRRRRRKTAARRRATTMMVATRCPKEPSGKCSTDWSCGVDGAVYSSIPCMDKNAWIDENDCDRLNGELTTLQGLFVIVWQKPLAWLRREEEEYAAL